MLNTEDIVAAVDRNRQSKKLLPRFIGPYTIVEQHSPVSFRVELPSTMKIHDVFHVDRFRHYLPSPEALGPLAPARPPPDIIDDEEEYEAEVILHDTIKKNQRVCLIKWKGWDREDSSWEPESNLKHRQELLRQHKQEKRAGQAKRS